MTSFDLDDAQKLDKSSKQNLPSDGNNSLAIWRDEFIDRLAHDLKTPLFGSRELLNLILNGACGKIEPEVEYLILLLKQTNEELLQLMQRFIEVYRYEAGSTVLQLSVTDLPALIEQLVAELQTAAKANEVSLEFLSLTEPLKLVLDRSSIQKALSNLLRNVIKHTRPNGHLELALVAKQDSAWLTLTASGLNLTRTELDGIFLLAPQLSASKSYSPMAGLELHLCRQIVHAHGGTVSTEETAGGLLRIIIKLSLETRS